MSASTAIALALALVSTTLTNLAYVLEHDAAAAMPVLSMRRPVQSALILLRNRTWMLGFGMESGGFLLYAAALALASLALVQSVTAGGIGVLAYVSARFAHRRLDRRELTGVVFSVGGLLLLGVSLAGGSGEGEQRIDGCHLAVARAHERRRARARPASGKGDRRRRRKRDGRRPVLLGRRRGDEGRDAGRLAARLRRAADPRLHAGHGLPPARLPGGRRAHGRRDSPRC